MKMKNILAMLLCLALFMSVLPYQVMAEETLSEPIFDSEVGFLNTLGVLDDGMEPYFQMTRAQFVKLIAKVMYKDVDFTTSTGFAASIFNDVAPDNESYPYLKACYDLNIIKGNAEGNFRPDDFITINVSSRF